MDLGEVAKDQRLNAANSDTYYVLVLQSRSEPDIGMQYFRQETATN